MKKWLILFCGLGSLWAQNPATSYAYQGRLDASDPREVHLLGAASSVTFFARGESLPVFLRSGTNRAYVVIEVDGIYQRRYAVEPGAVQNITVTLPNDQQSHRVAVIKATEATTGDLIFLGTPNTEAIPVLPKRKRVEFIGNSITSGMGNDPSLVPCGEGEWMDQHNAYYSYAAVLSRKLDVDYLLSSVSGIGMYRNWNDEHQQEAIMPEVYEKLGLIKADTRAFPTDFQPDLVSICLGTNDFSDGDGKKKRLPFNEKKYIANYVAFAKTILKRYPDCKLILLNSPMVTGEKNNRFVKCLKTVQKRLQATGRSVTVFEFPEIPPHGCGYHPDIEDDKRMAEALEADFKKLLE